MWPVRSERTSGGLLAIVSSACLDWTCGVDCAELIVRGGGVDGVEVRVPGELGLQHFDVLEVRQAGVMRVVRHAVTVTVAWPEQGYELRGERGRGGRE